MPFRRFRQAMTKRLDETAAAARADIPAQNVRDQLPGTTLPPGGPGGTGYPPTPADGSTSGGIKLTNDLGGTATAPLVVGWQGVPLDLATPSDGDIARYNSTSGQWELFNISTTVYADLVDSDGVPLVDSDGAYLVEAA